MMMISLLFAAAHFLLDKPKVKLKRARTRNVTKFATSSWLIPALVLSSLIIRSVVLHCSCDLAHATASLLPNEDAAGSRQEEEKEVIEDDANQEQAQLEPVGEPRFEPSQQRIIVGSRWQSEIFLPCTIFGLDKSQTVSCCAPINQPLCLFALIVTNSMEWSEQTTTSNGKSGLSSGGAAS